MDFHSLVRKDLQALCKLNKFPANRTNVAMAEALSSLQIVKGIEKYCKSTESSVAESSVESPEKDVVTSPKTTRTGRRKQVREGSGVLQTATPITRRKNRLHVASVNTVQRVYNTRLSARLSKKELMESEKKECVEAVKISSYCHGVSHNDFGEILEDNSVPGYDNVGVDSPIPEIEQQSESVLWENASKALDLKDTSATNMKSEVLAKNVEGFQILEMPSLNKMAVVDLPLYQNNDDAQTTALTDMKAVDLNGKGSGNVGVDSSVLEIEQQSESLNWISASKDLDSKETAATTLESSVPEKNVEGFEMDAVEAVVEMSSHINVAVVDMLLHKKKDDVVADSSLSGIDMTTEILKPVGEMPSYDHEAEVDMAHNKMKDDVVVDLSLPEIEMTTEVLANEVKLLPINTEKAEIEMPILKTKVVEQFFSPQKEGSDDVEDHFFFSEADANVDAAVTRSTDRNGRESLKDHSNMKSSEEVNYVECVQDMTIQLKSEKVMFKCWSSGANNFVDGENFDISVKIQEDISCNSESGGDYDNEKGLACQEEISGKAIASDMHIHSESNDKIEKLIYNNSGDDTSVDTDFFQNSVYSKKSDSKRKTVSVEFADQLEMTGSIEATNDFSGRVTFIDEPGDKDGIADDPESNESNVEWFQILPSLNNMALVGLPLYQKKDCITWSDDAGVGLCLSETDNITDVIPSEVKVLKMDADKAVTPTSERKAAIPILSPQEKGSVDVGFSYLTNEVQSRSSKRANGENLDDQITALTDLKAVDLNGKGSDNGDVDFSLSEIEQRSEAPKLKYSNRYLDLKDTAATNSKSEVLINKGSGNVGVDSSVLENEQQSESLKRKSASKDLDSKETAATTLESRVPLPEKNVKGYEMDVVEAVVEMPSHENMAVLDMLLHKKKDDVVADSSLSGIDMTTDILKPMGEMPSYDHEAEVDMAAHNKMKDNVVVDLSLPELEMTTEVLANEVKLLPINTEKAEIDMPILKTKVVEQVFSPQKEGPDDVEVHFSFSEGSDDVEDNFSFSEADANVDASVTRSTDKNGRESLKDHSNMESSEEVNYVEHVHDMMIQPKSEKVMFECWSSGANNFVDGENFDSSVKIQEDISSNSESGGEYDNEKGLASQEEIGKCIGSDMHIYSESNEKIENSMYNNSGDTSVDTDFFQHSVYSKQSDNKRKAVSVILSCNGAVEFADQLEMTGSIEAANDFSGGVPFVDELGDKDGLSVDPESNSKIFVSNSCYTEAESDFLEFVICSKQHDRKRESIASQIFGSSCTREPADQSETPVSSVGFSSDIASYEGKSITKESRLLVASDISSCCLGIKKLSFDESQQASEVKSPSLKLSERICLSSAPPSLQSRRTKITYGEPPLILADYPFTQKVLCGSERSLGPCQFANISNHTPMLLSSTTSGHTSNLTSNLSDDKENMEQIESKGGCT